MQGSFDYGASDVASWSAALTGHFGPMADMPRRSPIGQLVKSIISSRTKDEVSARAYRRLAHRWRRWAELAAASPPEIERTIHDVTFPEKKAAYVPEALGMIGREHPDFRLDFLRDWTVEDALAWLERLPGVGRKVAAATLNASTLGRRVFIVDEHVRRILGRLGFVGEKATGRAASEAVTNAASACDAEGLLQLFAQIKRLGQTLCRFDIPECDLCPLAGCCRTARSFRAGSPANGHGGQAGIA